MASEKVSADQLDPGDLQDVLTGSQTLAFLESEMECNDDEQSVARKRKCSEDDVASLRMRAKRPTVVAEGLTSESTRVQSVNSVVGTSVDDARSSKDARTVLIHPIDEQSKKMFISPEQLCIALESEPFQSGTVKDVRVNRRKGLLAVEMDEKDAPIMETILKVAKLGPWNVRCTRPSRANFCYGVVGPVSVETDLDALYNRVGVADSIRFVKMERLPTWNGRQKVSSTSVKVVFEGQTLPKKMKIGYNSYTIREYKFHPLQCFRCQRYGHSARGCTSALRCFVCAGPHSFRECTAEQPKCANCGGDHKANSAVCGRAPKQVEKRQPGQRSVSIGDGSGRDGWVIHPSQMSASAGGASGRGSQALPSRLQRSGAGQVMRTGEMSADVCLGRGGSVSGFRGSQSYNSVVSSPDVARSSSVRFSAPSVSAAVPAVAACSDMSSVDFLSRLTDCLTDLFSLSLHLESASKSKSLISVAIQKHFDVVLPSASLSGIVRSSSKNIKSVVFPDVAPAIISDVAHTADEVCSVSSGITNFLGVDSNFELISDSDMSVGGCAEEGWITASSGSRSKTSKCKKVVAPDTPSSSPILGTVVQGRKGGGTLKGRGGVSNAKSVNSVDAVSQESHSVSSRGGSNRCGRGGSVQDAGRPQTRSRVSK